MSDAKTLLDGWDQAWIVIYLLAMVGLGLWSGRGRSGKTARDYFLGGGDIHWWAVGFSILATETSALTFISIPGLAFDSNLAFLQIVLGFVLARLCLAAWWVPLYFKGEIYSPYSLLQNAFGSHARRLAGGFFLVSGTLAAGVRVYAAAIPLQIILGIPIVESVAVFVLVSLVYTFLGGIRAVIWTDAAQFVLLLGGGLFALYFIPMHSGLGWEACWNLVRDAGKTVWFDGSFSLAGPQYNIWMGVIGATCLGLSTHGADQLIVQRVLSCRSVSEGRKALMMSAAIILPLFLVFLLTGLMLYAFYQMRPFGFELPEAAPGVKPLDFIFPGFIATEMPHGVRGLLIVGVLAAAMSSVSSALSALASVSVMDLLKDRILNRGGESSLLKWSRGAILFWAILLMLVAWASQASRSAVTLAFSLSGLVSGAMLAGVSMAIYPGRLRQPHVIAGMLASFLVMTTLRLGAPSALAWPWQTLTGTATAWAVAWVSCRVFSRES